MLKRIEKDGELYCLFIPAVFASESKYNFLTPNNHFLQIGINTYEAGEKIKSHVHIPCLREVTRTEEIILLRKGRLRAYVFDEQKNLIGQHEMQTGDVMYLARGGHGFELHEACEIFEVKQGPYISQTADKQVF